jgi:hypothetical protein
MQQASLEEAGLTKADRTKGTWLVAPQSKFRHNAPLIEGNE